MESNVIYNGKENELTEDFIDVGYMAENIEVKDFFGKTKEIKRSDEKGSMTLLVSFPHVKNGFEDEITKLDKFMSNIQVDIHCYFIFSTKCPEKTVMKNRLDKFEIVYDDEEEFGNMYGTKIVSGELEGKLTKAMFLISKDGAVFYLDMPQDLSEPFDMDRLKVELNKAYVTYTGVGCH